MSEDKRGAYAKQQQTFQRRTEKLFMLLSSDHDGEVAAAARALLRHLAGAGIDIHRAAKVLALAASTGVDVLKAKTTRELAERLLKHETLRSREFEFLLQMSKRRVRPSQAQEKWLRDIEARLAGEAAVA
jgi:hypothetical protein